MNKLKQEQERNTTGITLVETRSVKKYPERVYYSAAVRHTITASSQKINLNEDQRQPQIAVCSTYTIIACAHNLI